MNIIKEAFTHKIEDPDSLLNFYEMFFNRINILNFDFNLLMIMNWLGDNILYSLGFYATLIIFIVANTIFFILLLNFDFRDYNENNKYGIWKFVHLLSIYIVIFVGLGGSSLLSQRIFTEFLKKIGEYLKQSKEFTEEINKRRLEALDSPSPSASESESRSGSESDDYEDDEESGEIDDYEEEDEKNDSEEYSKSKKEEKINDGKIKENKEYKDKKNKENNEQKNKGYKDNKNKENNNEIIEDSKKERKSKEESMSKENKETKQLKTNTKFNSFFWVSLVTIFAYIFNFTLNLIILQYKEERDEKINNETYAEYNETFIYEEYNNTNITKIIYDKIYDSDQYFFFYVYLSYYLLFTILTIILYTIIISCFFVDESINNVLKEEVKEKMIPLKTIKNSEDKSKNHKDDKDNNKEEVLIGDKKIDEVKKIKSIKDIKDAEKDNNKNKNSYTICKFCGYFYYCATTNKKEKQSCIKKFLYGVKDFFVLICKSLLDCCNATLCHIINVILCGEEEKCVCNCECCGCEKIKYNKISENFCFCYKEKRKYKWFHDYISSQVQKDIIPYVLQYFLLSLIIIAFDKKFIDFKVKSAKGQKTLYDEDFSTEDYLNNLNDYKK